MKLGHNQLRILRFIAEQGREVTYAEIVEQFKTQYYANAAQYISQSLASMVKNGAVKRVIKGVYAVGTGKKPAQKQETNQPTLF